MSSHAVGAGLVRIARTSRWTITCVEYAYGVVRLERSPGLTQVVVGECVEREGSSDLEASYVAAACTHDGELLVVVRSAPPGLVVSPTSCRTRPGDGASQDVEVPTAGERLILLSCAVFESVPDVLVEGVNGDPATRLATQDAETLLVSLVGGAGRGAGVVIDHHTGGDGMS